MNQTIYDVAVLGGGASGMMAAATAAKSGARVLLLEKNLSLGNKLAITGGGRCNIMNGEEDLHALLANYGDAAKFLYSPFATFGLAETRAFFEENGLSLKTEARQRVFPESERAADVVELFVMLLERYGVDVRTNEAIIRINHTEGHIESVTTKRGSYVARNFILATGGLSHPETGSTGDGFGWLSSLGHSVKKPNPSLVPLLSPDRWVHSLAGTALDSVRITFSNEEMSIKKTGRLLFTHFGLSGPMILNAAREVSELLKAGDVKAIIDLFPGNDDAILQKEAQTLFTEHSNKAFKNVVRLIAPPGLGSAIASLLPKEQLERKTHSITRPERQALLSLLRALPLTITGTKGDDWSIVSDGGVDLSEIDTRTMRSRLIDNLFVTGDLLHISRPSGGFSLQLCWTTGAVAGMNAAKN